VTSYNVLLSLLTYDSNNNKTGFPNVSFTDESPLPFEITETVPPGTTLSLFNGTRTVSIAPSTVFTLTLSPLVIDPLYRMTWTAGTNPVLRTDRGVDLTGRSVAVTMLANETVTVDALVNDFSGVLVGDTVCIPGLLTGDSAGPFNEANVGFWQVLSKNNTSSQLQLARAPSTGFSGITETVTVTSASQFFVYSPGPVQIGDYVNIVNGFSSPVCRTWKIQSVTSRWFEIMASDPLPSLEVGTAGASMDFYSHNKRFFYLLVDQEAEATLNSVMTRISPSQAGYMSGLLAKSGPSYSLSVTNKSAQPLSLKVRGV